MANMMPKMWTVLYEDDGGRYARRLDKSEPDDVARFHVIGWEDMESTLGSRDFEEWKSQGNGRYCASLKLVDLLCVTDKLWQQTWRSCGWEDAEQSDPLVRVDALHSYGAAAPLEETSSNNLGDLLAEMRRHSREYADPHEEAIRGDQVVNLVGSSAREYAAGVFYGTPPTLFRFDTGALTRHGITDDPLAYVAGFTDGIRISPTSEKRTEISSAYFAGFRIGMAVRCRDIEAPEWVRAASAV